MLDGIYGIYRMGMAVGGGQGKLKIEINANIQERTKDKEQKTRDYGLGTSLFFVARFCKCSAISISPAKTQRGSAIRMMMKLLAETACPRMAIMPQNNPIAVPLRKRSSSCR